jgi:O-antigen/teichoic acid export membrane protein
MYLFRKGYWAVIDQGLFSITSFFLNIALARLLSLEEYGSFASSFAVLMLIGTLHTALLSEPLLIYGAGKFKKQFKEYFINLYYGHFLLSLIFAVILFFASVTMYISGNIIFAKAFLGLTIAEPFIFLSWLVRRACYAKRCTRLSAFGGFIYMLLIILGCITLYLINWLTPFSSMLLMGFSSLCVSIWILSSLFTLRGFFSLKIIDKEILLSHLSYGKWAIPSCALMWIPANIYYIILPFFGYVQMTAILKAQTNLLMPLLQFNVALATQLIPAFVQHKGKPLYNKLVRRLLVLLVLISVCYWGLLNLFKDKILLLVYGQKLSAHSEILWILGMLPIFTGIIAVVGSSIRSDDRPDQLFWTYLLASLVSLTLGFWLLFEWKLLGVAIAIILSYLVNVSTMIYFYFRNLKYACGNNTPSSVID